LLRWWSWKAAWTSANLEASARLVEESRHHRERRRRQRRREVGPTAEEAEVLEAAFRPWRSYVQTLQRKLERATRQVSRQHGTLLLISLDHWVEAVLPARRAENLRRRRHVRFNLTTVSPSRSSPPLKRVAASPGRQAGRRLSAGPVGQWAQSTTKWQVAAALGGSFLASEDGVDDYATSADCMSPGSVGSAALLPPQLSDATVRTAAALPSPSSDHSASLTWLAPSAAAVKSSVEGTGGTSTPSVLDTPLRQTPVSTPRGTGATGAGAPPAKSNMAPDHLGETERVTYMPLGLPQGGKMVPLHLKQDQAAAMEPQTPQALNNSKTAVAGNAPAAQHADRRSGDILRFFKMRAA